MTAGEWIGNALWSLIPVAGVGLIVWIVFRAIVRADSKERQVYSEIEAEERAKRDLPTSEQGSKKGN
jgi:flagellar biosynthesis/type III secretory pathway M-ring protein FliF/YscJ